MLSPAGTNAQIQEQKHQLILLNPDEIQMQYLNYVQSVLLYSNMTQRQGGGAATRLTADQLHPSSNLGLGLW